MNARVAATFSQRPVRTMLMVLAGVILIASEDVVRAHRTAPTEELDRLIDDLEHALRRQELTDA